MTIWRRIPIKAYPLVALIAAIGLGFWNFALVTADTVPLKSNPTFTDIQFTLNSGDSVSLPGTSQYYQFLVFWSVESERSKLALGEAAQLIVGGEYDSVAQFYLVNVSDSLPAIRDAVNFDNLALPFGYAPTGEFIERYQIRSLPVVVVLNPEGLILTVDQGYSEGLFKSRLDQVTKLRAFERHGASVKVF